MVSGVYMLLMQHQNGYSCCVLGGFPLTLVLSPSKPTSLELLWLLFGRKLLMLQPQELESYISPVSMALTFTCLSLFSCNRQVHCVCYTQNLVITCRVVTNTVSRVWMVIQLTFLCLYKQIKMCQDMITET